MKNLKILHPNSTRTKTTHKKRSSLQYTKRLVPEFDARPKKHNKGLHCIGKYPNNLISNGHSKKPKKKQNIYAGIRAPRGTGRQRVCMT